MNAGAAPKKKRHRQERTDADLGHHQFDGEHDAADRRVEGRCNARARAGSDQDDPLTGGHPDDLAQGRPERRADLDDRPLAPDRGAATDRDRGGQRFDDGDDRPNDAALVVDRVHHFRHAMALRFRREGRNQEGHANRAHDRDQDDQRAPRALRREEIGVVAHHELSEEQQIVQQPDQVAEGDRAEAGDDTDQDREDRKTGESDPGYVVGLIIFSRRARSGCR